MEKAGGFISNSGEVYFKELSNAALRQAHVMKERTGMLFKYFGRHPDVAKRRNE